MRFNPCCNRLQLRTLLIRCLRAGCLVILSLGLQTHAAEPVSFERIILSEQFFSEGADFGDINQDGHNDVVSGPFWYAGPRFKSRHRYTDGERISIKAYSPHFFSFIHDFNNDRFPDILVIGMPGQPARWFENPGSKEDISKQSRWRMHLALKDTGNESPTLTDLTGDGRVELVCVHDGVFGYASPNWKAPTREWQFTPINNKKGFGIFTHGLGVGDVDGDGTLDVLETNGWHRQPAEPNTPFTAFPQKFAHAGGSQMFAYDFDGDGDNDVLSVQNAHAYGLTWFERRGRGEDMLWVPHTILTDKPNEADRLPAISQMHAVALADMDGDGIKDIVTGKRFFAHGGGDPGAFQLPVLYWLRTIRLANGVRFEANLIDNRVGVGTQLTTGDINGDGRTDILVGNKLGTHVLLNRTAKATAPQPQLALAKDAPGTEDFARGVRETGPLTPEQEQATFVLPPGFQIQLIASEPQINKPMNIAFDARGRLWVTSTLEYPYPVEVGTRGRDSVKILEDTDSDGHYEKVTTFADGLNIPIGLYPYQDGVICYSIPHIWHLRDTDGDGKCDQRDKLYGPFDHTRDTHGMCNSFVRGPDGWVYACHGFNNQSKVKGEDGNEVVMHSGNTFRFKLDGSRIEHFTHGQVNPFGLAYDARGDLLSADCHTKPVTLLLQGGYYDSFGKPHDGLGYVPDVMDHLHGSTAIGGIAISSEQCFPDAYANNTFGGNVMTSRINRNSLTYSGSSVRAQEEPDLLISGDSWFRPVDLKFGPNGALYVADFYNRIIGHYEVPLEHPGRDRKSGRIWRISYHAENSKTDATDNARISFMSIRELASELGASEPTRRMLAADRLTDEIGSEAATALATAFAKPANAQQRINAMWSLHRLAELTDDQLAIALRDQRPLVRAHAFRLLGDMHASSPLISKQLIAGFADPSPMVRRVAATAATQCVDPCLIDGLLELARTTPESDPHLRHAARMALRDQLKDESVFREATDRVESSDVSMLAGICLSLKTNVANQFLGEHIESLASDRTNFGLYIKQAMKSISPETAQSIVQLARKKFADDQSFQVELLHEIKTGETNVRDFPSAVKRWAADIAADLLDTNSKTEPISWKFSADRETGDAKNPWIISTLRRCADNQRETELWSSFPNGEQRTGVYRSNEFELPMSFEFFVAGHDGYPEQELQNRNFVRVLDAESRKELKRWSPPRNDTAQHQRWETGTLAGKRVVVELVDGDSADAYAWIAVGRFSVEGLNPNRLMEDRSVACTLIRDFKLTSLTSEMRQLMLDPRTDLQTRSNLATTWADLQNDCYASALAEGLQFSATNLEEQVEISQAVIQSTLEERQQLLSRLVQRATQDEQSRAIKHLVAQSVGKPTVLDLAERGRINQRVLSDPAIQELLSAGVTEDLASRITRVLEQLPPESESIQELIDDRKATLQESHGNHTLGKSVFDEKCSVCHQVEGKGKQVGPNLDGIGNRGVDRLCEDVLAPHRNVDVSFRASTLVLDDGRSFTGLIKHEDQKILSIVDSKGVARNVSKREIELRKQSQISAMPANLGAELSGQEFVDLMSYLLTLNR